MSSQRYSPEFKEEAVRQVLQRGYSVVDVADRVGVSAHSLYKWVRAAKAADPANDELSKTKLEVQKLKAENRRLREERDILKKAAAYFAKDPE
jgi:transposase